MEWEFRKAEVPFSREQKYTVNYKGIILPHHFYADFVVHDKIILEAKAVANMPEKFTAMAINYLKVSNNKLALLSNFGEPKLKYKRLILEKKIEKWKRKK